MSRLMEEVNNGVDVVHVEVNGYVGNLLVFQFPCRHPPKVKSINNHMLETSQ